MRVKADNDRSCRVTVPARSSICVLDMNQFQPGRAGGGNLGFALSAPTDLEISASSRDEIVASNGAPWRDERRLILIHVIDQWRIARHISGSYKVVVHQVNRPHIGLAASAALQLAGWYGLDVLHGSVATEALREKIASSYRESVNGLLVPGFTTGLSSFLGIAGGFAVVDTDLAPRVHFKVPNWTAAVVIDPSTAAVGFGDAEIQTLTGRAAELDAKARVAKDDIVNEVLIPAVAAANLRVIGEAIGDLQSIGSKVAEIDLYGERISRQLVTLRHEFECVFMSAVGPGIVVLSSHSPSDVTKALSRFPVTVVSLGNVDNLGVTVNGQVCASAPESST